MLGKFRKKRNKCICCGYYTLIGDAEDIAWAICPVCFWENDVFKEDNSAYSGANHMTLGEGRENYQKYGACSEQFISNVRKPNKKELQL